MNLLAFDTATRRATVAVSGEHGITSAAREVTTHSEGLLRLIDEVLEAAGLTIVEIGAIACGRGPGSFTGLRIGMATAKGLCFAASCPLICVSSLAALAGGVGSPGAGCSAPLVAALIDARRGEVFCGLYRAGELQQPELVCVPDVLGERLPAAALQLVGDGALRYEAQLREQLPAAELAAPELHAVDAARIVPIARVEAAAGRVADLHAASPVYLRAPDIRTPKDR